jgi:hypothetical protein
MTTTARDIALKYLLRREAARLRTEAPGDAGSLAVCEHHIADVYAEIAAERAAEQEPARG